MTENPNRVTSVTTVTTTRLDLAGAPVTVITKTFINDVEVPATQNPVSTPPSAPPSSIPPSAQISTPAVSQAVTQTSPNPTPTSHLNTVHTTTNFNGFSRVSTATSSAFGTPAPTLGSQSTDGSSGLPTGAIAGIAIGCAAVGLVIGLLAACILLRRKRKQPNTTVIAQQEAKAYENASPITSDIHLNQFLLDATPDREIVQEVRSLGDLIGQHVENYYHLSPINIDVSALSSTLDALGWANGNSLSTTLLCLDPQTRQVGLRHVILMTLFSSVSFPPNGTPSLLPPLVTDFANSLPHTEKGHLGDPQAITLALRRWRILSAFLLHPHRSQRTPLPPPEDDISNQVLGKSLNSFLQAFVGADRGRMQQQTSHLQAVIGECAKLGYVLFSHPSDWALVTDPDTTTQGVQGLVVEAGLDKLTDRDSTPYPSPHRLLDPVVVACLPK